jgi:hypothetical protein
MLIRSSREEVCKWTSQNERTRIFVTHVNNKKALLLSITRWHARVHHPASLQTIPLLFNGFMTKVSASKVLHWLNNVDYNSPGQTWISAEFGAWLANLHDLPYSGVKFITVNHFHVKKARELALFWMWICFPNPPWFYEQKHHHPPTYQITYVMLSNMTLLLSIDFTL